MQAFLEFSQQGFDLLRPYPLLQALIIFLAFLMLAKLADRLITSVVPKIVSRTKTNLDDQLVALMHRQIFSTVAMIGLVLASYRLELGDELRNATVAIIQTLLIVIWLAFGLRLSRLVLAAMRRQERRFRFVQQTTEPLLTNAVAVMLFLAGVYAILVAWNINVTGLVASAGIVGLALSFAAQDTLSNRFADVFLSPEAHT